VATRFGRFSGLGRQDDILKVTPDRFDINYPAEALMARLTLRENGRFAAAGALGPGTPAGMTPS